VTQKTCYFCKPSNTTAWPGCCKDCHWAYEKWNVGNAKGNGEEACFKAVLADPDCSEYFTYAHGGDLNCGCKVGYSDVSVRADPVASHYRIEGPSLGARLRAPRCAV
jgi:hypothetical protein